MNFDNLINGLPPSPVIELTAESFDILINGLPPSNYILTSSGGGGTPTQEINLVYATRMFWM